MNGKVDNTALQGRGVRLGTRYQSAFKGLDTPQMSLSIQWQDEQLNDKLAYSVTLTPPNHKAAWHYQEESLRLNDQWIMQRTSESKKVQRIDRGVGFDAITIENHRLQVFLEALKSYAIYTPTTPALRDFVTDMVPLETDFPMSFCGNRLAEAIEEVIDLKNETYGHLDLDDVLDMLDWTDNITTGVASVEILSPYVPRLQKVIRFTDRFMPAKAVFMYYFY